MSSRGAPSTYRANTGGTIHTETDNPALLALLRENSTADHSNLQPSTSAPLSASNTTTAVDSSLHPQEHAQHNEKEPVKVSTTAQSQSINSAPQPRESARTPGIEPQTPTASAKSPVPAARSVSQTIIRKERSNPPVSRERSANPSSAVTPVSRIVPSETDSASSELALLAGTSSRKSFVLSAAVSEADFGEEADDEGGDTEDANGDVDDTDTPTVSPSQLNDHNSDRADHGNTEREPAQSHPTSAPGVSSAASALPPGGRASVSSVANPSILRGSVAPSPDLTHPDHQRFVTTYASRRLKDKPVGRSSAVSFALTGVEGVKTTLSFPQEQSWSATQAARLRAGAGDSATADRPSENTAPDSTQVELDPVDSLDFPTDRAAETGQPPALENQPRDATPVDENSTTRSSSPPPIEGERINGPTPQPRALSTPEANSSKRGPEPKATESSQLRDSLDPTQQGGSNLSSSLVTPHQRQEAGSVALSVGGSSIPNSARATPASILKKHKDPRHLAVEPPVDRVYVESPTFTREEEEEYRFVSSRLDNDEEDPSSEHPTFRGLDQQAVSSMEGGAAVGTRATKKPFKQVRYQDDEDRYEDREEILQYRGTTQPQPQPRPVPQSRQYVLKSKTGSAQAANRQPQQPVRGLLLPSGPSYDPADEEELKRETSYQQQLKDRLNSIQRSAEDTVIPRLPLWPDSEEYRDSLDIPEDVELDSERLKQHRNSIDLYEQQRLHQAMQNTQWGDPPPPPPGPPQHGGFPPQRAAYGNGLRQGYAEPQRGYGDPQRQGYADPQRQGYADPQRQGYGEPQRGYGSPERQGYSEPQRQGYADPQRQEYADPQRQGYGEPQRGYGSPERQGYGEPQRQGYADPQRQEYADPQRQGYGEPQRQGYGDPNNRGGYYGMYNQEQQMDMRRGQNGPVPNQPQPMRVDPRYSQDPQQQAQPPPQQGGFYAQETQPPPQAFHANPQQYVPEVDPRSQGQGHYMESGRPQGYSSTAEPQDGYYLTEPRGYSQGPGPMYGQDGDANVNDRNWMYYAQNPAVLEGEENDRYQLEDNSQKSTARENYSPPRPEYDYVSHNKYNYGRLPKRTYKKIHEVKKEEEEKLSHIFIQPKVKGKGQKGSRDSSPTRYPAIEENPGEEVGRGPEELWAQRSASLAHAKNPKKGKKKPSSNTPLLGSHARRMYHSDSSIPNTAQTRQAPTPASAANQMQLVPAQQPLPQVSPVHSPPYRQPLDLKPITQELITEDGQRISVDVNLRLISPPVGAETEMAGYGRQLPANHRQTGLQYPVESMSNGQQPYRTADENDFPPERYSADDVLSSKNIYASGAEANGNPGGYASDSNHDYGGVLYTTNPYKKIPPIPTSSEGAPRSAPVHLEGSYMQSYLREKEKVENRAKPWYRVYGLKDYKRMQNEVRLGTRTLGPDLDNETYKERRERMLRQHDYAKAVKDKNAKELMTKKPPAFPRTKEQDDMLSKRKLAVEYAKNVPKPTVKPKANPYNSYELASKLSPIAKPSQSQRHSPEEPSVEVLDLEKLHERHQRDKQSAEMIRQKAQGIVS